jgi:hypothetical protein
VIVTANFIYVHLHKSGGSFVSKFLLKYFVGSKQIGYHLPLSMRPPEVASLPVLGSIRSPWEAYVSYYFFQLELLRSARRRLARMTADDIDRMVAAGNDPMNGVDALFEYLSDGGTSGFARTTGKMLSLGADDDLLDGALASLPTVLDRRTPSGPRQVDGFRGMNVRASDLAAMRGTGEGLYTFLFRHMYGAAEEVTFLRRERLREGLLDYLAAQGVAIPPELADHVRTAAPANTSRHGPPSSYYDAELAELVGERDRELVTRFGYTFDDAAVGTR